MVPLATVEGATPDSAYAFVNDVVAVEAEALRYNSNWSRRTDKTGFTGSAWLQYVGPERHGDESSGIHDDLTSAYQGGEADWLKVPVYITQTGNYFVQVRAFHTVPCCNFLNGDATVWTHAVDYPLPVRFSHGETAAGANTFSFLGYGPLAYNGEEDIVSEHATFAIREAPQVVTFYVSGRDRYFGVDRIQVYRRIGPNNLDRACYPVNADNALMTLSSKIAVPATGVVARGHKAADIHARAAGSRVIAPGFGAVSAGEGAKLYDLRGASIQPGSAEHGLRVCAVAR